MTEILKRFLSFCTLFSYNMGTIYLLLIIIYLLACNFIPAPLLDGLLEIWRQKPCESKNDHHMALQAIAKKFEFRKNIVQYPWVRDSFFSKKFEFGPGRMWNPSLMTFTWYLWKEFLIDWGMNFLDNFFDLLPLSYFQLLTCAMITSPVPFCKKQLLTKTKQTFSFLYIEIKH